MRFSSFTKLPAIFFITLLALGCAPRPDFDKPSEIARVFGECSFKLNTTALDLNVLPESDPRVIVIQDIVDNLVASRYSQFPWKIKTTVLDNPAPNAFTTGGGYLGAFSGVYAMAETEAALAGVIAHEIAHMDKLDNMELADYLESLLAKQLIQDGIEDYDTGTALKTVVDFCLAIPGLVSFNWKSDINTALNEQVHPEYSDAAAPYVPFTFSDDDESPYSSLIRDPNNTTLSSTCNNKQRDAFDQYVVINPEFYLEEYPDRNSIPEIPDDIVSGPGGLPGVQSLWGLNPWIAFQHTAFGRYAECQSDEAGILNLFASGYNPLALNGSFQTILDLFDIDETHEDFRFLNHPALTQRIEDNREFINLNDDVLPGVEQIESTPSAYQDYIVMADQIDAFENLRDTARRDIFGTTSITNINPVPQNAHLHDYEPITVADIAVALNKALNKNKQRSAKVQALNHTEQCNVYQNVYRELTGKSLNACPI